MSQCAHDPVLDTRVLHEDWRMALWTCSKCKRRLLARWSAREPAKSTAKMHMQKGDGALCGQVGGFIGRPAVTSDRAQVDCDRCLSRLNKLTHNSEKRANT